MHPHTSKTMIWVGGQKLIRGIMLKIKHHPYNSYDINYIIYPCKYWMAMDSISKNCITISHL